jgi:hypothetical protein
VGGKGTGSTLARLSQKKLASLRDLALLRGPAFVAHVLRVALGILEPETIKQTLE